MEVNHKNKRFYNTARYPARQPLFFVWLILILSKIALLGKKFKVDKVNMDGLKPPYILLSNHMHFVDFELVAHGTWPHRVNNVVSIDGYIMKPWLMEWIGCICKRKFTTDLHLVKSIRRVVQNGDIMCMYPEARYTPIGTTAMLPESLGKLVKMNKVPVVVAIHRGNYLRAPFWDFRRKRNVPMHTTLTQVLTADQVEQMTPAQINAALREALQYDEYRYQQENGILITEPYRAEGLHKVLYQCPACKKEYSMDSQGAYIFCKECGKRWYLQEDGHLQAESGQTEFSHIPDWFEWEREQVRQQILDGTYHFEDDVDVYSLRRCWRYIPLGKGKLTHKIGEGFVLTGFYNGAEYRIERASAGMIGLHVEYDFGHAVKTPADCVDISTDHDSFYCFPTQKNVITKLSFATEELYKIEMQKKRK